MDTAKPVPEQHTATIAGRLWPGAATALCLLGLWQLTVTVLQPPPYLFPAPASVFAALVSGFSRLGPGTLVTAGEALAGLALGIASGTAAGCLAGATALGRRLALPLLTVLQSFPVFAIAPLLVLWFGFGIVSKIVMATLVIAFPVAASLADGLRRTDPGLMDLALLGGAGPWQTLALIRLPSALPSLVTGIRMAAVFAPIGAVIGEWAGSASGLGSIMLQANARMQTDLMFAAVLILGTGTLLLKAAVDALTRRLVPWAEDLSLN